MSVSHPAVHPVEAPPPTTVGENVPARVRMKNIQGMPGTIGGLALRFFQLIFAAASLSIMSTTSDFPSVTAFRYLVAATGLQCLWSFLLAMVDVHALLVGRTLQNYIIITLFAFGDGITSTLTYAAACSSAGITVLIGNDLGICNHNHCAQFESATALSFLSWFVALPSFLFNFWSLASPR
ncbi:CASP-like protein 5A2 [Impatiens glandulifera]|uniref:CASP-like protein 5A2 n=1 Tax=Impatiens glandulifera TaxID=253017 RepID=UPI001FB0BF1F|nr:CASP-like protein 5A2 [Impatiens glandulifera]